MAGSARLTNHMKRGGLPYRYSTARVCTWPPMFAIIASLNRSKISWWCEVILYVHVISARGMLEPSIILFCILGLLQTRPALHDTQPVFYDDNDSFLFMLLLCRDTSSVSHLVWLTSRKDCNIRRYLVTFYLINRHQRPTHHRHDTIFRYR